jgi:hypothetical protein
MATISLEGTAIVLAPPYVLPSTNYMKSNYPASLTKHLLSLTPSNFPLTPSTPKASKKAPIPSFHHHAPHSEDIEKNQDDFPLAKGSKATLSSESKSGSGFLGMQTVKAMDMRNWGWPGYLTFGRSTVKTQQDPDKQEKDGSSNEGSTSDTADMNDDEAVVEGREKQQLGLGVQVDANNLADSMSSDDIRARVKTDDHLGPNSNSTDVPETLPRDASSEGVTRSPEQESPPIVPYEKTFEPLPSFASAVVRIQDDSSDIDPTRQTIFHITARIYFLISLLE